MKVAGLSHRQMAEALNAKGISTPSQMFGKLGNQIIRPAPGPRRLWNKTQVQRILKHLEEVSERMRWWRRHLDQKMIAAPTLDEAMKYIQKMGDPLKQADRESQRKLRNDNRIRAARRRQEYREKVLGGAKGDEPSA
jgi:hypothetical protein